MTNDQVVAAWAEARRPVSVRKTVSPARKGTVSPRKGEIYVLEGVNVEGVWFEPRLFTNKGAYERALEKREEQVAQIQRRAQARRPVSVRKTVKPDPTLKGYVPFSNCGFACSAPVYGPVQWFSSNTAPRGPVARVKRADRTKKGATPRRPSRAVPKLAALPGPSLTILKAEKEAGWSNRTEVRRKEKVKEEKKERALRRLCSESGGEIRRRALMAVAV
jgi:hypothetical protein